MSSGINFESKIKASLFLIGMFGGLHTLYLLSLLLELKGVMMHPVGWIAVFLAIIYSLATIFFGISFLKIVTRKYLIYGNHNWYQFS